METIINVLACSNPSLATIAMLQLDQSFLQDMGILINWSIISGD